VHPVAKTKMDTRAIADRKDFFIIRILIVMSQSKLNSEEFKREALRQSND